MKQYKFKMHGLDCANCANTLENKLSHKKEFKSVKVSFATATLTIETDLDPKLVKQKLELEIHKVEPEVTLHEKPKITIMMMRILLASLFFLGGIVWNHSLLLLGISYLVIGYDILWKSLKNIIKGHVFDEFFLMSIATIGAFAIGEYPEGVAVMLFFQIGEYVQKQAVNRSRQSITELVDMKSSYANLVVQHITKKVDPDVLKVGDQIICKPGEKIPADGIIIDGKSTIDSSMLTGESVLRAVTIQDRVLSGCVNVSGLLRIEVEKTAADSMASTILNLIEHATEKKAHTERFITRFAKLYTPVVVFLAVMICLIPTLFGASFSECFYKALVFLVISCPCALVISIPLGFFSGIGAASRAGILMKGSDALEMLPQIDTIVFDKTGTLTCGKFAVTAVAVAEHGEVSIEALVEMAAQVESGSTHPIAASILDYYGGEIDHDNIHHYQEYSGKGVAAEVGVDYIMVGNQKWMKEKQILVPDAKHAGTIVYVARNDQYIGYLAIADQIKPGVKEMISTLKEWGLQHLVVVSGDHVKQVEQVCHQIGITKYHASVLPDQKAAIVEKLMEHQTVMFVGDGINDALVLTTASLGVSMGGIGSDAAIEASDVVIMNDDVTKLISAIQIATHTKRIIWFNILFALLVKGVILLCGVLGFTTIWLAVFADVGVTLLTILNTLRIHKRA